MKILFKLIIFSILLLSITTSVNAGVDFSQIDGSNNITEHSINIDNSGTINDNIQTAGLSILTTIKYIVSGLLVIFIVYIGIQMIMSMGTDEDKLTTSKKQLRFTLMGLIFINIPFQLYNIFLPTNKGQIDGNIHGTWYNQIADNGQNIFINVFAFDTTINGGIVTFIESVIFSIAIFMIVLSGIKIILSSGKQEDVTEAKNKILWSIIGLVFIGFIKSWQALVYNGRIADGANMFKTVENLALFFAGPVAIFFLTLAGYYYITSNGDEEKVKKAKNIIINTIIATVILLASYAFLKDLITLSI